MDNDKEFRNIQNYCTFSIKEKINNAIPEETGDDDNKWGKAHKKLKNIETSNLDSVLKQNKEKETADQEVKKSIKEWCTKEYKKPYKGDEDEEFKNASKICVTS